VARSPGLAVALAFNRLTDPSVAADNLEAELVLEEENLIAAVETFERLRRSSG